MEKRKLLNPMLGSNKRPKSNRRISNERRMDIISALEKGDNNI